MDIVKKWVSDETAELEESIIASGGTLISRGRLGEKDEEELKIKVREFIRRLDPKMLAHKNEDGVKGEIISYIEKIILAEGKRFSNLVRASLDRIAKDIIHEVLGYGQAQPFLEDPEITEVMINAPKLYYEKNGQKILASDVHISEDEAYHIIERIVSPIGRKVDESTPMADARLPDGSRVNIIIPPLARKGPTITIRKFSKEAFTVHDLISFGTLTEEIADFIRSCVEAKLNIVIAGGTGSGKTTTLNVVSSFISGDERIVTIEDAAELQLQQPHVVSLEARPANIEGKGEVSIRDLVKNALRMYPDRIVVGEVRGGEALDMLQAMNTGHKGSLTTVHANGTEETVSRLETMTMMAGMELPMMAIRKQIAAAIDLIIYQHRMKGGQRKITELASVEGMKGDEIILQHLISYKNNEYRVTDQKNMVSRKIKESGVGFPEWAGEAGWL